MMVGMSWSVAGSIRGGAAGAAEVISGKTRNWGEKIETKLALAIRLACFLCYNGRFTHFLLLLPMPFSSFLLLLLATCFLTGHAQTGPIVRHDSLR